uniref:Hemerythrin-like domain-containing protein n=1 Tax=Glycine max TaxID=3847 RepID=C6TE73_SOYBN|nr:unknown [Glycine max]
MMEHAQMEETILFPLFDKADRGLAKVAKEEHARDLPLMNGIKEVIKSVGVLDSGSPDYHEALCSLPTRLKSLQGQCKQHFAEEEVELLPLMKALELSKEQEVSALEQCFEVMQGTHNRLLKFFS